MIVPISPCMQPMKLRLIPMLCSIASELSTVLDYCRCVEQGQELSAAQLLISYMTWLPIIVGHGLVLICT